MSWPCSCLRHEGAPASHWAKKGCREDTASLLPGPSPGQSSGRSAVGDGVGCRTCRTPTVTFLSSSWQINPGLEILVQQSRVRPRRGGATLQWQSLGKMKNKYRFLQGTKFVTGSCLCHGRGRSPPAGSWGLSYTGTWKKGWRRSFVPVGFSNKAEQSQFPAADVPPLPVVVDEGPGVLVLYFQRSVTAPAMALSLPTAGQP